jgi:hypothetical protein
MGKKRTQEVNAGDTFLITHPYNHTIQDAERIVLVNFTTFEQEEETCCIVNAGEHPFITRKSCIRYKDARVTTAAALGQLAKTGKASRRQPVSGDLLARIRNGASESDFLPEGCRHVLQAQSLI